MAMYGSDPTSAIRSSPLREGPLVGHIVCTNLKTKMLGKNDVA